MSGRQKWTDDLGRHYAVECLDETDPEIAHGLVIGPPLEITENLRERLGEETVIRLHNELFHRGLLTAEDARRNPVEVEAALKATLRVDAGLVMEAYRGDNNQENS